ncbi:tRNA synthetases class I, catalytic domain-containing protein, partial [Blyttiomyces helicus]
MVTTEGLNACHPSPIWDRSVISSLTDKGKIGSKGAGVVSLCLPVLENRKLSGAFPGHSPREHSLCSTGSERARPSSISRPRTHDEKFEGINPVLRSLARKYPSAKLYGTDAVKASQVDYWLDFAQDKLFVADFKKLSPAFDELDHHLKLRSFFVGHSATLADYALWGALKSNAIFSKLAKSGKGLGEYLIRWYSHISSLDFVAAALAESEKTLAASKTKKKDQGSFDIGLEGAERGKVCTRFPPEPSGYLHLGHAKAALLNEYFAKTYEGKLIVRFDDTNPSKEKSEFEESIKEDLLLIGVKGDEITYTSDSFDKLFELAIEMIKKGLAYVDDTTQEQMQAERWDGINSKCRDLSIEDNLKRFEEMAKATEF